MKNKIGLISAFIFFLIYGISSTLGSFFLVTWGSQSLFKKIINFLLNYPIDWDALIMRSLFFLLLNIIFWSFIVYISVSLLINLFYLLRSILFLNKN